MKTLSQLFLIVSLWATCLNGHAGEVTDVITKDKLLESGIYGYKDFSNISIVSSAVYAGNINAGNNNGIVIDYIQMRASTKDSGIITTASGGKLKSISVVWSTDNPSGHSLYVYGKSSPYTSAKDLYVNNKKGVLIGTITESITSIENIEDYSYIGICSSKTTVYLDEIRITWEGDYPDEPVVEYESFEKSATGYCSYVTNNAIDVKATLENNSLSTNEQKDIHLYKVIEFDNTTVVLSELGRNQDNNDSENIIPQGTPVIIKYSSGTNEMVICNEQNVPEVQNNLLRASDGTVYGTDSPLLFVLQKCANDESNYAFYRLRTGRQIPAGKAYLSSEDMSPSITVPANSAKGILYFVDEDGEVNGLRSLKEEKCESYNIDYDAIGIRNLTNKKGIHIINGKKYLMK